MVNEAKLLLLVSEILEINPDTLRLEDDLDSLGWDSLSVLSLMSKIDLNQEFNLDAEKIAMAKSVKDLVNILI